MFDSSLRHQMKSPDSQESGLFSWRPRKVKKSTHCIAGSPIIGWRPTPSKTAISAARRRPTISTTPPRWAPAFVNNRFLRQMQSEDGTLDVCKWQQLMQTVCLSRRPKMTHPLAAGCVRNPPHSIHHHQQHHECRTQRQHGPPQRQGSPPGRKRSTHQFRTAASH